MKNRMVLLIIFFLLLCTALPSSGGSLLTEDIARDNIPQPRLIEPVADTVDLSGKKELVFKWSPHEGDVSRRKYYDFRLYNGYQTFESTLILKKQVSKNKHEIAISSDVFKLGNIYTWTLRQKYRSGKSLRSTSTFKVIKK